MERYFSYYRLKNRWWYYCLKIYLSKLQYQNLILFFFFFFFFFFSYFSAKFHHEECPVYSWRISCNGGSPVSGKRDCFSKGVVRCKQWIQAFKNIYKKPQLNFALNICQQKRKKIFIYLLLLLSIIVILFSFFPYTFYNAFKFYKIQAH